MMGVRHFWLSKTICIVMSQTVKTKYCIRNSLLVLFALQAVSLLLPSAFRGHDYQQMYI